MRAVPVIANGVPYPSVSAAAEAIGVTRGAIIAARAAGRLARVGSGRPGVPCEWRGHPFPSFTACARHLGYSVAAVQKAFHAGRLDRMEPRAPKAPEGAA